MPADINSYALGLELQLQTKPAFEALTKIEQKLAGIETKMANLGASPAVAASFERQAEAVGLDALRRYELEKAVNDLMAVEREQQKLREEVASGVEHLNMTFEEQAKREQQLIDKHSAAKKALKELSDDYKGFSDEEKDLFNLGVDVLKQNDERIEQHKKIQEQFDKYSKTIKLLKPVLDAVGISQGEAEQFAIAYSKGLGFAAVALALLARSLKEVMAMQEAYAKTTFRALGSQYQLIKQTNELRSTLGATTEEGVKTLTALAGAGFRASDSISELASANLMFSKATGVSADTTADYQRRLTTMGLSAAQAAVSLGKMAAMIRNSGLSAQQAQGIIQGLNKTLMRLNFAFGPKQAKETGEAIARMGAAAQAAGGDATGLASSLSTLATDGAELRRVMGAAGIAFDENASRAANLTKLMKGAAGGFKDLGIPAEFVTKVLADMGFEDVALNSDLMNKKAKELKMSFDQYVGSLDQGADLTKDFNDAMATFKDSLHRILAPLLTLGAQLMDVVGPAIVALLKPLVWVATAIGNVVSALDKIPGVSLLVKGAIMMMIVPSIFKAIGALTGLGKSLSLVTTLTTGMGGAFKAAVPSLLSFGGALTKQIFTGKLFTKQTVEIAKGIGGVAKSVLGVGGAAASSTGAVSGLAGAAEGAGMGLGSMGGGALRAVMGFAKLHPILTAIVAAVAGAFLIVPKLFEMFNTGSAATSALAVALMGLFWPLTSLYVTLRTVWAVVKGVWEAVSELAEEAFKPLTEALKAFQGPEGKAISLMDIFNKGMDKLTKVVKVFMKAFTPVVWMFKMLGSIVGWVVDGVKKAIDKFAPVVKFAEWAITKISKFLGLDEEAAEESEKIAEDLRTPWEKMWGTQEQVNDALKRQQERLQEAAAEAKAFSPEVIKTIQAVHTPPPKQAEPVVSPVITDQTARSKTNEINEKMLDGNIIMRELLLKIVGTLVKTDTKSVNEEMVELLKTWLPKIAEEKTGSLATAANQWL